jgi:ornithine cyclodeaminase
MLAPGTHINAVGAIVPERAEVAQDVFPRCAVVAVDSLASVRDLSRECREFYDAGPGEWAAVAPLSALVAAGAGRPPGADLTLCKAMGMGISDLAVAIEVYNRAKAAGRGRSVPHPVHVEPHFAVALENET